MKILAFETATEACSVALWVDGEVGERHAIAPRRHAELALPWADALLAEAGVARAQLDAIAVGRGPGAFTGVRLGIALAQGIALALDRQVLPVSTLAALAMQGVRLAPESADRRVLAAIDARMGELYVGRFARRDGTLAAVGEESLATADAVELPDRADASEWVGVGTGFAAAEGRLQQRAAGMFATFHPAALPHAADIATLAEQAWHRGEAVAPEFVEPGYLRNNVALTSAGQQALRDSRKT